MSAWHAIRTIAKRELVSYFTSPVAYVFLVIFLLLFAAQRQASLLAVVIGNLFLFVFVVFFVFVFIFFLELFIFVV